MKGYYLNLNQQISGQYELHTEECLYFEKTKNFDYIGYYSSCEEAIRQAKLKHPDKINKIDGCYYCCNECNNG